MKLHHFALTSALALLVAITGCVEKPKPETTDKPHPSPTAPVTVPRRPPTNILPPIAVQTEPSDEWLAMAGLDGMADMSDEDGDKLFD